MKIIEVKENKKQYLDLLLLADEQENMIDRYLDKGKMYVLDDNGIKSRYCFLFSLTSIIFINRTYKFKVSVPYKLEFI